MQQREELSRTKALGWGRKGLGISKDKRKQCGWRVAKKRKWEELLWEWWEDQTMCWVDAAQCGLTSMGSGTGHLSNTLFCHLLAGRSRVDYFVCTLVFPSLKWFQNSIFIEWSLDFNELTYIKHLEQCLKQCKHTVGTLYLYTCSFQSALSFLPILSFHCLIPKPILLSQPFPLHPVSCFLS